MSQPPEQPTSPIVINPRSATVVVRESKYRKPSSLQTGLWMLFAFCVLVCGALGVLVWHSTEPTFIWKLHELPEFRLKHGGTLDFTPPRTAVPKTHRPLTFMLANGPETATCDEHTGRVQWVADQPGTFRFTVAGTTSSLAIAVQTYLVVVEPDRE